MGKKIKDSNSHLKRYATKEAKLAVYRHFYKDINLKNVCKCKRLI